MGPGTEEARAQRAIIRLDNVPIYASHEQEDPPIALLSKGEVIQVIGQRGDWIKIEFAKGRRGWMLVQARQGKEGLESPISVNPRRSVRDKGPIAATDGPAKTVYRAEGGDISYEPDWGPYLHPDPEADVLPAYGELQEGQKSTFAYSFGAGLIEAGFAYEWRFLHHTTDRLALVGSIKHALGEAADSYLLASNWEYLLKKNASVMPYVTVGAGVIVTSIPRDTEIGSISNMMLNYGLGLRKKFMANTTLVLAGSMYSIFAGSKVTLWKSMTVGLMVGKFWD